MKDADISARPWSEASPGSADEDHRPDDSVEHRPEQQHTHTHTHRVPGARVEQRLGVPRPARLLASGGDVLPNREGELSGDHPRGFDAGHAASHWRLGLPVGQLAGRLPAVLEDL